MNFTEFVQFMQKREKRLELIFDRIDADNDSECGNKKKSSHRFWTNMGCY